MPIVAKMTSGMRRRLSWRSSEDDSSLPEAERALMAQSVAYLYAGAATLGLVSILFFELHPRANVAGLLGAVAGGYVMALVALIGFDRLPLWSFQILVAAGTGLVALSLYYTGDPRNDNEVFYVLVAIYASYFFTAAQAATHLIAVGVAYALALAAVQGAGPSAPGRWVIVMGVLVVAAVTVSFLKQRVERLVASLADAARTDPLTRLLNRRGFQEEFEAELARVQRTGNSLSLAVGDLDKFKKLNDASGHAAGDRALRQFGELLAGTARRIDTVARIGGEEFALLMPGADSAGARSLAERVRSQVADTFSAGPAPLTISFGITTWTEHGETAGELLLAADRALYAAKEQGRNRCVIQDPSPSASRRTESRSGEVDAEEAAAHRPPEA